MQHPFRERLVSGRSIVADGAMGTELYARGISYDECFDGQNIEQPEIVEQIHREYLLAGAELLETNTFGANRLRLATWGLEDRVRDINIKGARIARSAREILGETAFVAGSIGPTGRTVAPFGQTPTGEVFDVFHEQIAALLEGGVDLFVLETFGDLREIELAVAAARDLTDLPIIGQMTFGEDLRTLQGYSAEQVVESLSALGVDVIGANCSVGSNALLGVVEQLFQAGATIISAMPNAGWPERVGDRLLYLSSPEYMAEYGMRMAEMGVAIVGGCCGTTPAHIRALKRVVGGRGLPATGVRTVAQIEPEPVEQPQIPRSELAGKLGVQRIISVEIRPPRGANPAKALQGARLLGLAGADAVNVVDSAMARVRMSAVATAVLIQAEVGVETILHFTTRDRNLMAIQADLIGAHALGVRNVLALTGDPPTMGEYSHSKSVYDVDSIGLIRIIKQLNLGVDIAGNSIGTPTRFLVGAALDPAAEDRDWHLQRFREKLEAGADFIMTQPVFDAESFHRTLSEIGPVNSPILLGILPLQSYRHALFLHNEVPGINPTAEVMARMEKAGPDGVQEGLSIAREMIDACGDLVSGIYIMPSFGRYEVAAQLVSELLVPA